MEKETLILFLIIIVPIIICQILLGFWVGLLAGIVVLIVLSFFFLGNGNNKKSQKETVAIYKEAERGYNDKRQQLVKKYGKIRKMFKDEYGRRDLLIIFEDPTYVYLNDEIYAAKNIIGCEIKDMHWKPQDKYVSKHSTAEVIGRSVVGELIDGAPGAIIGGTTAKQTTTNVSQNFDCNYVVTVQLNDDNHPHEKIAFGNSLKRAEEFATLINLIIKNKKTNP